ncbi:MAG: ABC transporter substrate-binding protein [Spirochaetales bacterium]|nr:ABC transporter substrate-binding protein [Spirochaetales bacterium]
MKRIVGITLLLLCCVLSVFASGKTEKATPVQEVTQDSKYGGRITIAMDQDIVTLNNFDSRANADALCQLACLETLFRYGSDGTPEPYLVESYEENPEQLTFVFNLRKGIKFHDGSDFNADVVAWHLNTYKETGIYGKSFLGLMDYAEPVDDYTVVVHMSSWDSVFLYCLCRNAGLVSSKLAYETNGRDSLVDHVVGTGPFKVASRDPGVSMSFDRFDDYWQGKPYLDGIDYVVYKEALVAQAAMEAGEIDAMSTYSFDQSDELEAEGFTIIYQELPSSCYTIAFNSVNPGDPFCDQRVRQAVGYALDNEAILEALFGKHAIVTNQYGDPSSAFYSDRVETIPYDIEKAKQLLAEAGYPNGFSTQVVTTVTNSMPMLQELGVVIAEQLSKIGINVTVNNLDIAGFTGVIGDWNYGMILHTMGMSNGAGSQISSNFKQGITSGIGAKCIKKSDKLNEIILAANNASGEESYKLFQDAQYQIFTEENLIYAIGLIFKTTAVSPKLHDSNLMARSAYAADLWQAWIEK